MRHRLILLLTALPCLAAASEVKEGQWEYRSEMRIPGMQMPELPPGVQLPPGMSMEGGGMVTTFQHCITAKDLVPQNAEADEQCKTTKMERKGNTVSWTAVCDTPQGKAEGRGTATYSGNTMNANIVMTGKDEDGEAFEIQQKIQGRHLGPCR